MKLSIEDVVICLALLLGFSTSLLLAIANQSWGTHFAPSLIAFYAAVSVAALIYRFLGGSGEAQFRMGVLQVTGSTAVLIGATWFLGDRIKAQTVLYDADAKYRPVIEAKQVEVSRLEQANTALTDQFDALKAKFATLGDGKTGYSLDQVRKMRADKPFVSGIRRMVANEDPPFRRTMKEIAARVTLNDAMVDMNVYRICTDTQDRLFDGLEVQKDRLRMRRSYGDGDTRVVDMERGGTITPDGSICPANAARTFDIQITCADALKLFPDRIQRCAGLKPVYSPGVSTIRGERVALGALPPQ